ncbi:MAG: cytochrome c-type biogenesis protein CcmH [Betaproteobacteria bacterium]|nr:cytochrome c-type biogenesis protein CcmH [Betaproteobacteria bacterium]
MNRLVLLLLLLGLFSLASAKEAAPLAEDPVVEKRVAAISEELRCLVCQNESLSASRADLAVDLRRQIREQIKAGRSDAEIMEYMVARYGDFVRYRPPLKGTTVLLWFGPFLLLIGGVATLLAYLRRRRRLVLDAPLSAEESAHIADLLGNAPADPIAQEAASAPPAAGNASPRPKGRGKRRS